MTRCPCSQFSSINPNGRRVRYLLYIGDAEQICCNNSGYSVHVPAGDLPIKGTYQKKPYSSLANDFKLNSRQ